MAHWYVTSAATLLPCQWMLRKFELIFIRIGSEANIQHLVSNYHAPHVRSLGAIPVFPSSRGATVAATSHRSLLPRRRKEDDDPSQDAGE